MPTAWLEAVKLQPPRGLAEPFATRAAAIYERYYAGRIAESAYLAELRALEQEAEKAAEEARTASLAVPAVAPTTSFFSERHLPLLGKKKGRKHGAR